jgi:hypothetical protein
MRISTWRAVIASALLALCAATLAVAQDAAAPTYPDGADGLKQLWTDILAKANAGDADGLRGVLEKMVLTDADFAALFGEEKGKELAPRYAQDVAKLWPGEAANLVARVKDRKYDEVEVTEDTASKDPSGRDRKVLMALKEGTKMYSVRIKRKGDKTGTRYDYLFFVNGGWKAGSKKFPKLLGGEEQKGGDKGDEKPATPPPAEPGK